MRAVRGTCIRWDHIEDIGGAPNFYAFLISHIEEVGPSLSDLFLQGEEGGVGGRVKEPCCCDGSCLWGVTQLECSKDGVRRVVGRILKLIKSVDSSLRRYVK